MKELNIKQAKIFAFVSGFANFVTIEPDIKKLIIKEQ